MSCNCHGRCGLSKVGSALVIIGGINWGLIGLGMLAGKGTNWNVVKMLLGSWPTVEAIVYLLVGISAIFVIFGCPCKKCKDAKANCTSCKVDAVKPTGTSSPM